MKVVVFVIFMNILREICCLMIYRLQPGKQHLFYYPLTFCLLPKNFHNFWHIYTVGFLSAKIRKHVKCRQSYCNNKKDVIFVIFLTTVYKSSEG